MIERTQKYSTTLNVYDKIKNLIMTWNKEEKERERKKEKKESEETFKNIRNNLSNSLPSLLPSAKPISVEQCDRAQ